MGQKVDDESFYKVRLPKFWCASTLYKRRFMWYY